MDAKLVLLVLSGVVCVALGYPYPYPQEPGLPNGGLPIPREGAHPKHGYFQYINVPAHKVFEWGYRRGNDHHNREEYLSQKDHTFKAKVKWHDSHGGHGEHFYDYNHGPSYKPHHEEPAYAAPHPLPHPGPHGV